MVRWLPKKELSEPIKELLEPIKELAWVVFPQKVMSIAESSEVAWTVSFAKDFVFCF